jgi:PPE-repeat protein
MDFAALPPEVNSGLMYAGPGSASMLAAAWDGLAAQLYSAAISYHSAVPGVTSGAWLDSASAAMAAAAATNVAWMTTTAAQAEQVASQAKTAFAMTVPTPVIAANRSLLALLAATNMYGYASASATAKTLAPFTPPASSTNPAGLASQAAAVTQAAGTSAGSAQTTVSQLTTVAPAKLQRLASPGSSTSGLSGISDRLSLLQTLEGPLQILAVGGGDNLILPAASLGFTSGILLAASARSGLASTVTSATAPKAAALVGATTPIGSAGVGIGSGAVAAGFGNAASIGPLLVPQDWTPVIRPVGAETLGTWMGGAPVSGAAEPAGILGLPRAGASSRAKRGTMSGDGIHPFKVIPLRGYTG